MTTIIMLALMTGPYVKVRAFSLFTHRSPTRQTLRGAAAIGLGLMFSFTSIGHFLLTEPMAQMLPSWVPARVPLIHFTGILEIAIVIGLFAPRSRRLTGVVAAAMLVLVFPANVYGAINHVPMGGHALGPVYLLI